MFRSLVLATVVATGMAFGPVASIKSSKTKVFMGLVGSGSAEGLAGQTAPLGYFDPLGLSTGKTDGEIKVSYGKNPGFLRMKYENLD